VHGRSVVRGGWLDGEVLFLDFATVVGKGICVAAAATLLVLVDSVWNLEGL